MMFPVLALFVFLEAITVGLSTESAQCSSALQARHMRGRFAASEDNAGPVRAVFAEDGQSATVSLLSQDGDVLQTYNMNSATVNGKDAELLAAIVGSPSMSAEQLSSVNRLFSSDEPGQIARAFLPDKAQVFGIFQRGQQILSVVPVESDMEEGASPSLKETNVRLHHIQVLDFNVEEHKLMNFYLNSVRDILTGTSLRTRSISPGLNPLPSPFNEEARWQGADWCEGCFTMAGGARVQNVRDLMEETITQGVPGDWLEAGTWRGGCSIMARVVQHVMAEDKNRRTYVCDSFSGLPLSSTTQDDDHWNQEHYLEVSQSEVEGNFKRFVPLDDNIRFRKGYFSESLPKVREELKAEGRQLAVLRGDGDMYESFMDILYNLYEFVSVGGYFICDDCPGIPEAQKAIDDFRKHHAIEDPIQTVDGSAFGTFWRKGSATSVDYTKYLEWCSTRNFKT